MSGGEFSFRTGSTCASTASSGTPRPEDPNRYETIARARNRAKTLGTSPWVMFLDDDVVLGPGCVARLVEELARKNGFAALGADSAGEMAGEWQNWDYPRHVGMAATLFRRERLERLTFRWEPGKCECRCCCDDLREAGFGIGYLATRKAWHRPAHRQGERAVSPSPPGDGQGERLPSLQRRGLRTSWPCRRTRPTAPGRNRRPNPDRVRPQSLFAVSPPVPDDAACLGQSRAAHGRHLRPSSQRAQHARSGGRRGRAPNR